MHAAKKYQVRREASMKFRIEDAEGKGGGVVAWDCKWSQYKARSPTTPPPLPSASSILNSILASHLTWYFFAACVGY
jgi:hypothetical protein